MKILIKSRTSIFCALILFVIVFAFAFGCKPAKTVCVNTINKVEVNAFENHLTSAVQIESEPCYYNILDRMKYYDVPGFSISIIKNGKIAFSKGYGYARKKDKIPVSPNTVFAAGSISKSIAALIIMKLRDEGKLSLDVEINEYLKSWKLPESRFTKKQKVTLRRLLMHTAGINNFNGGGYRQNEMLPTLNDVLNGKGKAPAVSIDTIPGSMYRYSNIGYTIVQKIIEDITGEGFEDVAKEMIFDPLKMTNSTFEIIRPNSNNTEYCYSYNKKGAPNKGYWTNMVSKASGALKTTPTDLAKLNIALFQSLKNEGGFLPMNTVKEMMEADKYGLGFDLKGNGNSFSFSHSGRVAGFFAYMITYPATGGGIVIMTNSDNGGELFKEVLRGFSELNSWDIIHPKRIKTVEVSQSQMDKYKGKYAVNIAGKTYVLKIKQNGKHLFYSMVGDIDKYPLRAVSSTKFIDIIDGEEFEFIDIENKAMKLITNGEYEYKRIK